MGHPGMPIHVVIPSEDEGSAVAFRDYNCDRLASIALRSLIYVVIPSEVEGSAVAFCDGHHRAAQ